MIWADITLKFDGRFIGDPYWPEQFRLIEITKQSGMNRARATAGRRKALEEHLRLTGMTLAEFDRLQARAREPFYKNWEGWIIIPRLYVTSFLVATCDEVRAAQKPCPKEQVRSRFVCGDFTTDRSEPDGVWERFATVSAGTGAKLSNQRGLRSNAFIENFSATGQIQFDEQLVDPDTFRNALVWGGQFVGIGASRNMGMGRFAVASCVFRQGQIAA
jgi:hypothetical protein